MSRGSESRASAFSWSMSSGFQPFGRLAALGLLAFAALDVGTEAAAPQRDLLVGVRILAEAFRLVRKRRFRLAAVLGGQLPGVVALGIVRAADEGSVLAELEGQLPGAAVRAGARIAAVLLPGKDERRELLVQRLENLRDPQFLGLVEMGEELLPEVAQHVLPGELAVGNAVELFFQIGGEVVLDIALEEVLQKGGDQAALGLRDQLALLDRHIFAVAQRGERRGIGRGPADAEFFHLLDERGFRIARRRLGEVLRREDLLARQILVRVDFRKAAVVVTVVALLAVLLLVGIGGNEAVEADDGAGRAQPGGPGAVPCGDFDRRALDLGRRHLAGDAALPDEVVEPATGRHRDTVSPGPACG